MFLGKAISLKDLPPVKRTSRDIVVTKQDGTVERFVLPKLANSLARVLRGRAYDARLATPLARAVAMHLREWPREQPPGTDYIYQCVTSVLQQTGLTDVADDLGHHRRLRAARRRRTRVLPSGAPAGTTGESWRKAALVATLENRYGLTHAVSRFLAGQIELQVFALNYRLLTRPFLAELVRNEVLAWGLADEQMLRVDKACEHPVGGLGQPVEED